MFPEGEDAAAEQADMDRLESRFLEHPTLALAQSKTVIDSMAAKTLDSVRSVADLRREYDRAKVKKVVDLEGMIDRYEDKVGAYLFKITSQDLNQEQSAEVNQYLRVLSDFERISDHARNIAESIEELNEKKITLTDNAEKELTLLENAVIEVTEITFCAYTNGDTALALRIDPLEEIIDDMCDEMKSHHVARVSRKECSIEHGFVFNDMLTDYERISDHCSNIAVDVFESGAEFLEAHNLHKDQNYRANDIYQGFIKEYKGKYLYPVRELQ
jgi:phosphate:Na+ symporter